MVKFRTTENHHIIRFLRLSTDRTFKSALSVIMDEREGETRSQHEGT